MIASALSWHSALAQLPDDDVVAMMKANYLYQFSNNNNWPTESKKGKFYVGKADLPRILKEYKDKPTLIVTSWDGAIAQGGQINFKMDNGFLRYQLDRAAMENRKITPGLKIIQWAVQ